MNKKIKIKISIVLILINYMNVTTVANDFKYINEKSNFEANLVEETKKEEISNTNNKKNNENSQSNPISVKFNEIIENTLEWTNLRVYYKINIPKNGIVKLDVSVDTWDRMKVEVLKDNKRVGSEIYYEDTESKTIAFHLTQGEYLIKVEKLGMDTTKYKLKTRFQEVDNSYQALKSNNSISTAKKLELNRQLKFFLAGDDPYDYFKLNITKSGVLDLSLKAYSNLYFEILDSEYNQIDLSKINATLENPKSISEKYGLGPGIYYLKVRYNNLGDNGAKYEITPKFLEVENEDREDNNNKYNANRIYLNTKLKGFFGVNDNVDFYKFELPRSATVELQLDSAIKQNIYILDKNEKVKGKLATTGSANGTTMERKRGKFFLDKGIYYIEALKDYSVNFGSYHIKVKTNIFKDSKNHWAENEIESFAGKGFVNTNNEYFRPNSAITRAEFIKLVNKVFGYKEQGIEKFLDVNPGNWYYSEVKIAIKAGYIDSKNKKFRPNDPITREEVATIITTIKNTKDGKLDKLNKYIDKNQVSEWARSSVEGAIENGYMGKGSNEFKPKHNTTRAETVAILSRIK